MDAVAKHPHLSASANALPLSVFSSLYDILNRFEGDVIRFSIGDTHLAPPEAARLGSLGFTTEDDPDLYNYAAPKGDEHLVQALVHKVVGRNQMTWVTDDNIQITNGCTHALSCSVRAVLDPGDEIILLAPYWPMIRQIAYSCSVHPVEVPFSHRLLREPELDPEKLIESYLRPRTAAIYMCTPNNPDGMVFGDRELRAIANVAARNNLWVISDEVYEEFTYDGRVHKSIATYPGMAERTMTAFSFSKSYGQAGLRVGYTVGPPEAIAAIRKMANASVYSVPRAMQRAAMAALTHGDDFLADARAKYVAARDRAHSLVKAPAVVPQGSTYLFLDLGEWAGDEACCMSLLERFAEAGLLLTPGAAFGTMFGRWARMCFTAVDTERLEEGIARLNRVLDETD